jgi:hypothetical protein
VRTTEHSLEGLRLPQAFTAKDLLMRSILISFSLFSSIAAVGCVAQPGADGDASGNGDGKADGVSTRQHAACRVNPLLKHPTSSVPNFIGGDKLPFALETLKVQEKIDPKFGGGFVTHTVAYGEQSISTSVRQLDPDLAIVSHPFVMDLAISRPRLDQNGNRMQNFRFHAEVFDVFTNEVHVHDVVTTHSAFSPVPYILHSWYGPDAANAATGELVGQALICNFKELAPGEEEEFEDTGPTIDDVAR